MDDKDILISHLTLAEKCYRNGDLVDASGIIAKLLTFPNTSSNHNKISKILMAYTLHYAKAIGNTHYDILRISDYKCSNLEIKRKYMELKLELNSMRNRSVAVKRAMSIVNCSWEVLSDPMKRREYDRELGFRNRELKRKEKVIHVVSDSDSD